MIPLGYWDRRDTPERNSPIGCIMRQLDAIYPQMSAEELRAVANERIHSGGSPGQVRWSRDESRRLKEAGLLGSRKPLGRVSARRKARSASKADASLW